MKGRVFSRANRAFTLIELLVVLAMALILLVLLVPRHVQHPEARRVRCISNLKQIAIGWILWSETNRSEFPWRVSVENGGTQEAAERGEASPQFRSISEFVNPRTFWCPADTDRKWTTNSVTFTGSNASYFVHLDTIVSPMSALAGDRSLQVAGKPVKPGLLLLTAKSELNWNPDLLHSKKVPGGMVLFADGHVEWVRQEQNLYARFQHPDLATNRLVIP